MRSLDDILGAASRIKIERRENAYASRGVDWWRVTSLYLRQSIRDRFAWPGGYELFGITTDGAVLCCSCMRAEYHQIAYARKHRLNDGWRVVAIDSTESLEGFTACDHCDRVLYDPEE